MRPITIIIILIFTQLSFAQKENNSDQRRSNEIGIEFLGLVDAQTLITFEKSIGKHFSGLIGIGIKENNGLFNVSGINDAQFSTDDINYSGYKGLLEGRYYLSEHTNGRALGFYLGLYIKYSNFNSKLMGNYTNTQDEDYNINFDIQTNVTSIGLMAGYKLFLNKRFAIDFLIVGPGSGNYNFQIQNKSDNLPDEFYSDFNDVLGDLDILDLIDGRFKFDKNKRRTSFNSISFRYAMSLKFNF